MPSKSSSYRAALAAAKANIAKLVKLSMTIVGINLGDRAEAGQALSSIIRGTG